MEFHRFLGAILLPVVVALEQSPDMVIKEGQSVNLECSQKKSSYTVMYWFMRPSEKNSSLTLLVTAIVGVVALEQSPDMVIKEGQSVNLECSQKKSSNTAMYWFMRPSGKNSSLTLVVTAIVGVVALEQSPDMVIKEGQSVNLECSQKKSSNTAMYWFMRPSGKNSSLTLVVTAIVGGNAAVEKGFESHFKSSDIKGDSITLTIERAFLNDSGTYYCAESEHSGEAAEGAEHKLVPAHTGPALHLKGAEPGRAGAFSNHQIQFVRVGDTVTLECSGSGKVIWSMSWYRVPMEKDAGMQLVVYSVEGSKADIEEEFKNRFQSDGTKNNPFILVALEQSPDMVIKEGQSVNLECSQKKSNYRAMYWFMRPSEKNSSLTQLVYAYEGANESRVEKGFESHFKSSDIKGDSITLTI
ncbi:hypothetical protein DUI87_17031 [Hirundo rustica rustica]|uniref:Ig-like domain-containing protein n=1 Tax=Hirundo rustica rustica TaxID=333673 RepID=A0A3M0KK29_HIRRU|nr:hypothetical protein DUI87_17031 [Hirundo rustica rustica]